MTISIPSTRLAVACLIGAFAAGCGVDRKCRSDDDCDAPRVCLSSGVCGIECRVDEDCADDEACVSHRCRAACLGCSFTHAQALCVHGDCSMGPCQEGFTDANGLTGDGCEYACTPTAGGVEICDHLDNDCDRGVDEDFDVMADPLNCGECDVVCPDPRNARPVCSGGLCRYVCDDGYWDTNLDPVDGCEDETCEVTGGGVETCDMIDNDCDGDVDEGIEKDTPESCGDFCVQCDLPFAEPACVAGVCRVSSCHAGHIDCETSSPGCETACTPTGEEVCDLMDNDCNCLVDDSLLCCPEGMVSINGLFCMDAYEASRPDATATTSGADTSMAVSQPIVMPWVTGSGVAGWQIARDACAAAGKRLCTLSEWLLACQGPAETTYCYGSDYDPVICNGIDAHCETPYAGCGHDDYLSGIYHFILEPTGSFESCVDTFGVYDINGNLWEWVDNGGASQHGGAYNCSDSAFLHQCTFTSTGATRPAAGFRCCM